MSSVIDVENLAKKYYIGHKVEDNFLTMREAISGRISSFGKRLSHPFLSSANQPFIEAASTEEFWALRDISFSVGAGEKIGIIGRNGAGKSTLLKILSRITDPSKGRVRIKGRVSSLLEVGTGFHPELTGRENIFLNGAVLGMKKAEIKKKFDEIVAFSEVEKFLDTPVKRYSSGMYVRLAFAVAAHLDPEILIVDEVLAVGDVRFQKKCFGRMTEIGKEGRTVLFVSHNMQAVKQLCESAILLDGGRMTQVGAVNDVVASYLAENSCMGSRTEILPEMHSTLEPELDIYRIEFINRYGETTNELLVDENFTLRIFCRIMNSEQSYRIGATFLSPDETALATVVSTDNERDHFSLEGGGRCTLDVRIKNLLLPGDYGLTLSVKTRGGNLVDRIQGLGFSVSKVTDSEMSLPKGGIFRLAADWGDPFRIED